MTFTEVASVAEITEGRPKLFKINGKPIAIFNIKGRYHALSDSCPHAGDPLSEGDVEETMVSCPCHGWQFDIISGMCMMNPMIRADTFEVKIEGDKVFIKL